MSFPHTFYGEINYRAGFCDDKGQVSSEIIPKPAIYYIDIVIRKS